jgi:hypothetical protein
MSNQQGTALPGHVAPTVQQMQQYQQMLVQQQQQMAAAAGAPPPTQPQAPQSVMSAPPPQATLPVPQQQQLQPPNPQLQSLPIRAYLDQTVVPILLDGRKFCCSVATVKYVNPLFVWDELT